MIGHLRSSHRTTKASLNNQSAKEILKNTQIENLPEPHNLTQQQDLIQQVIKLILSCTPPLSIVSNEGFKIFCHSLDPKFKVPGIDMLKTIIFDAHNWTVKLV